MNWGFENYDKYALSSRLITGIQAHLIPEGSGLYRREQNQIANLNSRESLYTPPVASDIPALIGNWENYVNAEDESLDPLIRTAIAHYQFEAIHPFRDGNGRTGRILMVLQLIQSGLLQFPILYISGYINQNRSEYYRRLLAVTTEGDWGGFIEYMVKGFFIKAQETHIAQKYNVIIATFGHVGDGNVHTTFVCDIRSRDDWNRLKPAAEELVKSAIEMKGTLSAEHGTGLTRAPHIEMQLGPAMEVMRKIKEALDPDNILNPGKMGLERGKKYDVYDYFAFQPLIDHPEGLNSYGTEIDNEVLACIHCGFCRLGCPTFSVTQREARNARGRNALAYYLMNGTIEPSRELSDAFYTCTTCQACTYFCPARIKVDEIVEGVRKKMYKAGMVPEPVLALRESIYKTGNIFASARAERNEIYPPALKEKPKKGEQMSASSPT